jgi:hypothetical protein
MLQNAQGSRDDQSSTHYRSNSGERTGEITKIESGQRSGEKASGKRSYPERQRMPGTGERATYVRCMHCE